MLIKIIRIFWGLLKTALLGALLLLVLLFLAIIILQHVRLYNKIEGKMSPHFLMRRYTQTNFSTFMEHGWEGGRPDIKNMLYYIDSGGQEHFLGNVGPPRIATLSPDGKNIYYQVKEGKDDKGLALTKKYIFEADRGERFIVNADVKILLWLTNKLLFFLTPDNTPMIVNLENRTITVADMNIYKGQLLEIFSQQKEYRSDIGWTIKEICEKLGLVDKDTH